MSVTEARIVVAVGEAAAFGLGCYAHHYYLELRKQLATLRAFKDVKEMFDSAHRDLDQFEDKR